jgi:hypothetical protein
MSDPIYENLNALYQSSLSEDFLDDPDRLVEDIINLYRVYRATPIIPVAALQAVVDELADYIQRVEQSEYETTSMYKVGFYSGHLDFSKRIKVTLTQLLNDESAEEAQS